MKITAKQVVLFVAHQFATDTKDVGQHFGITPDQARTMLHKCPGLANEDVNGQWERGIKSTKIWQIEGDEQNMTDAEAIAYIAERSGDPDAVLFDTDKTHSPKRNARKVAKAAAKMTPAELGMTAKSHPKEYLAWVRSFKAANKGVIKH